MNISILEKAANFSLSNSELLPASKVVEQLLAAEKINRKEKPHYSFEELLGTWKLRFITGTKKTRAKAGVVLGTGRYIPKFIDIALTYYTDEPQVSRPPNRGRVNNSVSIGILSLSLTGPVKFLPSKNILAFDFTTMTVKLGSLKLYHGYIRNGRSREIEFAERAIANSAFFVYFLIHQKFIAARGRGGGLALWSRVK